jgi:hypothetical protein
MIGCFLLIVANGLQISIASGQLPESPEIEQALVRASSNRGEIEQALKGVSKDQKRGMRFLVANMPEEFHTLGIHKAERLFKKNG